MGRTLKDALATLAGREHYANIRKVLSYYYFTPTDLEDQ